MNLTVIQISDLNECNLLRLIGDKCREHRKSLGLTQKDIAKELGYTSENISSFENGRNDNSRILLWYLSNGVVLQLPILKRGVIDANNQSRN